MIILSIKFGYICKEMKNVEDISGKQKNRPKTRMDQGIDEQAMEKEGYGAFEMEIARLNRFPSKIASKPIAIPHSLPPKPSECCLNKLNESKLQKSVIDDLKSLQSSLNPTEFNISMLPQTLSGLEIHHSQFLERQRVDFSLSSDYLQTEYELCYLRKKVEQLLGKLTSMTEDLYDTRVQAQFYKKKVEDEVQKNKQLQGTIVKLNYKIKQSQNRQEQQQRIVEEIKTIREQEQREFANTRKVGQMQIEQLTQNLRQKVRELTRIKEHINEQKTSSSVISQKLTQDQPQLEQGYMKRFFQFAKSIDQRMNQHAVQDQFVFGNSLPFSCIGSIVSSENGNIQKEPMKLIKVQNSNMLNQMHPYWIIKNSQQFYKENLFP